MPADLDPLPRKSHPAGPLEPTKQSRDDLPHRAKLVGQGLVRRDHDRAMPQEAVRQALVESLERHGFDQRHQVSQAVGEDAEYEAAEWLVRRPSSKAGGRQQYQLGGLDGRTVRRQGHSAEQA